MRYKNGGPVKLYVVVDQESGDVLDAATRKIDARQLIEIERTTLGGPYRDLKIVNYVQEKT